MYEVTGLDLSIDISETMSYQSNENFDVISSIDDVIVAVYDVTGLDPSIYEKRHPITYVLVTLISSKNTNMY